ncbi:MAG: class I mannose-6-phosphate isomerase, partial [Bacteroidales bacterium]|nr:class I mannose-6-phosphate isomerase [Bacteroidales bacterium]
KLRHYYDVTCYFDVTPKEVVLRAKRAEVVNLGDRSAKPFKALLRRCYYVDFEVAGKLRWELLKGDAIDFYMASTDAEHVMLLPGHSFSHILSALVRRPFRCKPVYLEGVWGGHYLKKIRKLPESMRNCAWVFDLIPLEVSIVVRSREKTIEFPFFTLVQKEGEPLMGRECMDKFGGYFPIRFNYDDSFHSSGNMSIQVHSGHDYNVENFGEHGSQDESYYVVATGHGAVTYLGFNENASPDEFIQEARVSEKEHKRIDYRKYINHVKSEPGLQVLIPAGTIHSSGRNQVVLEIGSLTVGSYTYKLYDYLRADLDGKPRPIHTYHGDRVVVRERTTGWVKENLVQEPQLVSSGDGWAEYIIGEHNLVYFSLRRLEFETSVEGDTRGKFHVLNLVDGEEVLVQSVEHPGFNFTQHYLDVVVVPANVGKYSITNLGNQPVCMHKTMLKDGFNIDRIPGH